MIPSGIYTIPEISSIGRSERELQEAKVPYEVGHCAFKNLARAQMTEERVGMLKIIFHAETLAVLGVHCFGDGASEIVHIGQTVMAQRRSQRHPLLHRHDIQLSDDGRGVSCRRVQRHQPTDLIQ